MASQICGGMVGPLANTGRLTLYQDFGHARNQAVSKKKKVIALFARHQSVFSVIFDMQAD